MQFHEVWSRMFLSHLQTQLLEFTKVALSKIEGILISLHKRLQVIDGVRLLLAMNKLLVDDTLVYLLKQENFV